MVSLFTSELLSSVVERPVVKVPLAVLCLSAEWGTPEEQTLALGAELHRSAHAVTLVVLLDSELHQRTQARQLPCYPLPKRWKNIHLGSAWGLARWLRKQQIAVLLTTNVADLALANLTKDLRRNRLHLVHRQLEPLPKAATLRHWWTSRQIERVDAWLAPTPRLARQVLTQTQLERRRVWVVSPALLPQSYCSARSADRTARYLLDLPERAQLIGVLDCGGDGPAFAIEALYRLRQEHGSTAELVLMGGPATPRELGRWAKLRELAQQLRLGHCVHLRPLHNAATPTIFYRALDALLLPGPADASGLHLLHAMASCCPLVSVEAADAPDLLENQQTAQLFPLGDVAACAQALCQTLTTLGPARRMAQRAAALVGHQCSLRQQGRQVEAIIEYIGRHEAFA